MRGGRPTRRSSSAKAATPPTTNAIDDILDVWFDSGSTHAFVVEARYGVGVRSDLYVEGSDQHRGWFQSSLLESVGTRGRRAVQGGADLRHGARRAGQEDVEVGRQRRRPDRDQESQGADILRLWVASIDYFDDVKIGKEVLAGASDTYRKLRNTFRYLLGSLDGWDEAERIDAAAMPELERWVLHRLAELDDELRGHVADFDFAPMMTALTAFANQRPVGLLFRHPQGQPLLRRRRQPEAARLPDGARSRFPRAGPLAEPGAGVHRRRGVADAVPGGGGRCIWKNGRDYSAWRDDALAARWERLRALRGLATLAIEPARKAKTLGSSLEADLLLTAVPEEAAADRVDRFRRTGDRRRA